MKRLLLILLVLLGAQTARAQTIPSTFFSNTIISPSGTDFPSVPVGMIAGTEISWPYIEQVKGTYNWTILDNYVSLAASKGVIMEYQTSEAPPWAVTGSGTCHPAALPGISACTGDVTDLTGWNDFLTQLTTRYNGNTGHGFLKIYELYIEPESFFTGAMSNLVSQTSAYVSAVRANSPTALVTGIGVTFPDTYYSPGNYMDQFWAAGGTKTMDAVSFHGYPHHGNDVPEIVNTYVPFITAALTRNGMSSSTPIWDTEGSWGDVTQTGWMVTDPAQQAAWVARSYLLHWSDGVSLYKWYAWDGYPWGAQWYANSPPPGFSLGISPAGTAYGQVGSWMVGATMSTPCSASGTVWTCGLTKAGIQKQAVWNTAGNSSYSPAPQYVQYADLAGALHPISGAITIGNQPVLLDPTGMPASCVAGTNVYYISSAIGSDARTQTQAKSKTTPWQHAPGMQNFTGTYVHTANDCFVFRGGDTWPAASFGWLIPSSMASTYIGVDLTWFTGGSFTQPLFDLNNTIPIGTTFVKGTSFSVVMVRAANITFDNLEIKRQFIKGGHPGPDTGFDSGIYFDNAATNGLVENSFFHDWVSDTANIVAGWSNGAGGLAQNGGSYVVRNSIFSGQNSMDLTRGVQVSFGGCFQNSSGASGNKCSYTGQGAVNYFGEGIHDNEFFNMSDAGTALGNCTGPYAAQCTPIPPNGIHTNMIEGLGGSAGVPVYNNLLHDSPSIGVTINNCSSSNIYNNVLWNNHEPEIDIYVDSNAFCPNPSTNTVNIYNNTVVCSTNGAGACVRLHTSTGATLGTLNVRNNHWITSSVAPVCFNALPNCSNVTNFNTANNEAMTVTQATTSPNNYIVANKYQSAGDTTTFAGVNLTSLATGNLAALAQDAEGTTWFGATAVARPTGVTKWNPGAYQSPFSSGGTPPVVSVAISGPGCPSACSGTATITVTASGGTISSVQPLLDGATFGVPCTSSPCAVPWNTTQSVNGVHQVGGTATNGTGQGTATPLSVTVNNVTPGCMTGGSTWTNTSFTSQNSAFSMSFTLQPFGTPVAGTGGPVAALSQSPAAAYADNSALVRQSDNGNWQVFNGSTGIYQAATVVAWQVGVKATFTVTVDFIGQTYSVQVSQGITNSVLAVNYPFRAAATSLGFINLDPETPPVTLQLCAVTLLSPTLSFSPSPAAFGNQTVSTTSSPLTVTVSNTGTGPQVLATPYFTISGTNAGNFANAGTGTCANGGTIPASGSCTVNLTFTPSATGPRAANLTINGTVFASDTLTGTGTAPVIAIAPSPVAFGSQSVGGTSAPVTVTVSNTGTASEILSTPFFSITGTNASDFARSGGTCANAGTIAASSSCTILLTFTPGAVGSRTANLNIIGTVNAIASITGTGSQAALTITPSPGAFGNQNVNTTSGALTITVTNSGTSTQTLGTPFFTITGTNATDFARSGGTCTNGGTIAASGSCTVLLTFTPPAPGARTGTLNILGTVNGSDALTGTGIATALSLSPTSIAFGNQTTGTSSGSHAVVLTNTGTATLNISSIAVTGTNASEFSTNFFLDNFVNLNNWNISNNPAPGGGNFQTSYADTSTGMLRLKVTQDGTTAGSIGGEVYTNQLFGFGRYDCTLRASSTATTPNGAGTAVSGQVTACFNFINNSQTEIDSPEIEGQTPNVLEFTNFSGPSNSQASTTTAGFQPDQAFHKYSFIWSSTQIQFLVDDVLVSTHTQFIPTAPAIMDFNHWGTNSASFGGLATAGVTRYMYVSSFQFNNGSTCGATLAPSASCTLNVVFSPTSLGSKSASLTVVTNASSSPDNVTLTGTGVAPAVPVLSFSPGLGAFGNQLVNTTSAPLTITVSNVGTATEVLNTPFFTLTGPNAADFTRTAGTCVNAGSIAVSGSCTVTLTFTPGATGGRAAALNILGTANGSAALSGTGTLPVIGLAPSPGAFGNQLQGTTSAPLTITVSNTGTGAQTLSTPFFTLTGTNPTNFARSGGTCADAGTIAASGSCTILLTFTPSATGARSATLTIQGTVNASDSLTGTGVLPIIGLSPSPVAFGNQGVLTTSTPITVTVSNTGTATQTLSTPFFTITGTNAADFARSGGTCTNGGTIAASASCTIILTFTPPVVGSRAATLNIAGTVNQSDSLTGTGVAAAVLLAPTTIAFGNQTTGSSSGNHPVSLTNSGNATLNISSITLTGADAAEFSINTNSCGATLAPGFACSLNVVFSPTTSTAKTASLTFATDAPTSPNNVPLTGTGVATTAPTLSIAPSPAAFGNQTQGTTSAPLLVVVSNTGTAPEVLSSPYFTITGTGATSFANTGTGSCANGGTIAVGAACTVNLTFTPAVAGSLVATLNILGTVNGTNGLTGTGSPLSGVSFDPTSIAFGNQDQGTTSAPTQVTLFNTGGATLTITSITVAGTNPTQFSINTNTCGATLAGGDSCTWNVVFSPTLVQSSTANVTVISNSSTSPDMVTLTGTGRAPTPPTTPAPAITIVSILPAGSVVLSATGSPVTPRNALVSDAGCSQDGITYTNPCKFSISCGNCGNKTRVWFNGVAVSQSYFKGIVTASVPVALIPIPKVSTDYQLALSN